MVLIMMEVKATQKAVPLKNTKDIDDILNYFLLKRDSAKTDIKKKQADRNFMLCLIGFNTPLRTDKLIRLMVKDVKYGKALINDLDKNNPIKFTLEKRIHTEILDYIERCDLRDCNYLFSGQKKVMKPLTRQQVNDLLREASEEIGRKNSFSINTLRKTFGYHYYKNGGKLHNLAIMFNHDSPKTTMEFICYDHRLDKEEVKLNIGESILKKIKEGGKLV